MTDATALLRELRPATPDRAPDEAALERLLLSGPEAPRPRRRRSARPLALAGGLAAAAVAIVAATSTPDGVGIDLAAQAYAQTSPAGAVIHFVETASWTPVVGDPHVAGTSTTRMERWVSGERSRSVLSGAQENSDQVLGPDGVIRNRIGGETQVLRPGDAAYAEIATASRQDPVSRYRRFYDAGELTDAGPATFDDRTAHAYAHTTVRSHATGPETERETFYVDPDGGRLLGSRTLHTSRSGTSELLKTLTTFERLPLTGANLARLTG